MEGPTPVSALIHAATMVTAGVFLIIRVSPLFEKSPLILLLIVLMGSFTTLFSATISFAQTDLKKVIAYSTCSQLGYMVMICGFSHYTLSLFHLLNHGFFKALLFLSAGSIIHALGVEQDLRKLGSLRIALPLTYLCILIGSISLIGIPFLSGFYSKELILETIYGANILFFAFVLATLATFFTGCYSFKLLFCTFINRPQSPRKIFKGTLEGHGKLVIPLVSLLVASILMGYLFHCSILKELFPVVIARTEKILPFYLTIDGILIGFCSSWAMFDT